MKKWIWGLLLVVSIAGLSAASVYCLNKPYHVVLAQVEEGTIDEKIFANGVLEPANTYTHYAPVSAVVLQVHVKKGDAVKRGQTLFTLDQRETERQLQAERNNLALLRKEREDKRRQTIEAMKNELEQTGTISEETKAKEDLSSYDLRIENQLALIRSLEEKLQYKEVTAKGDGIVTELNVSEGQMVTQGAAAAVVADLNSLIVRGSVNELDANKVKPNMEAIVSGDAFQGTYKAKLTYIAPLAAPADATSKDPVVEVTAAVESADGQLRPGYRATLEITLPGEKRPLVPIASVKRRNDQSVVFRVADGIAKEVPVQTGKENETHVEILEGLKPGEQIVAEVRDDLKDGQKVNVR